MKYDLKEFDENTIAAFRPAEKIGLVASINPEGLPHLTLITSIGASSPRQVILGEFCKGESKSHIRKHPAIGFLVMTLDRRMWRGHARWTHLRQEGPEYEAYNALPMFRYNAYFGINTVHYLDLIDLKGPDSLPLPKIILSALMTKVAKGGTASKGKDRILTPFGENLFNRLDALKFMAYIKKDGYPEIIPLFQCQAADSRRLAFSTLAYGDELLKIPDGCIVAVFGMTMKMEDVMVRGIFRRAGRSRGISTGAVDIDWVYNSMPPCHGQIYPPLPLAPVTEFADF